MAARCDEVRVPARAARRELRDGLRCPCPRPVVARHSSRPQSQSRPVPSLGPCCRPSSSDFVSLAAEVRGADRDQVRVVGGRREAWRALAPLVAGVPGRGDHDDAVVPGLLGGVRERVDGVRLRRVRAVRQVEDADVQAVVGAVLDDPVDGRDDLRDVHATVGDADLEADDPCAGGDAAVVLAGAGDQPGHRGAVAVGVEVPELRRLGLEREVRAVDELACARSGRAPGPRRYR